MKPHSIYFGFVIRNTGNMRWVAKIGRGSISIPARTLKVLRGLILDYSMTEGQRIKEKYTRYLII